MTVIRVDNPATGNVACEVPVTPAAEIPELARRATAAAAAFAATSVADRIELCGRFAEAMARERETIACDITLQMGKPIAEARSELDTLLARTRAMMEVAEESLAPIRLPAETGYQRLIEKIPLGVVLDVAAWNYPLLTAVNVVVPAVLAGNAVILKHSSRTPLCAGHFAVAFEQAGAPVGLVTGLVTDHETTAMLIGREEIDYVAFTGSVPGGRDVSRAARGRFIDVGLELGGKDAAYVRRDADVRSAAASIAEGAFYNAGQSCCAVERIYVDQTIHDDFVAALVEQAETRPPMDPTGEASLLGPLAQPTQPDFIAQQLEDAIAKGARIEIGGKHASVAGHGRYFECTVLSNVTHAMNVMTEETFGPVAPVEAVASDDEALARINDSRYGLTASVWTRDVEAAHGLASRIEAGTIFLNRCDYVDPLLPWAGWKDSGVGMTLSHLGLDRLIRTRARHFRLP